jgi:hypothetical protein
MCPSRITSIPRCPTPSYEFNLKKSIRQGKLRPLHDPDERDDLAA